MPQQTIITTPVNMKLIESLKVRDAVFIDGVVYTARDQAHRLLVERLKQKKELPVDLKNQILYYTGPTPKKDGLAIGACGPTTSSRMDKFTPSILAAGVKILMGKGSRSPEVIKCLKKYRALYLVAPGGAGAYLSVRVKTAEPVAFKGLGAEAVFRLEVEGFPAVVAVDSRGNNMYGY